MINVSSNTSSEIPVLESDSIKPRALKYRSTDTWLAGVARTTILRSSSSKRQNHTVDAVLSPAFEFVVAKVMVRTMMTIF